MKNATETVSTDKPPEEKVSKDTLDNTQNPNSLIQSGESKEFQSVAKVNVRSKRQDAPPEENPLDETAADSAKEVEIGTADEPLTPGDANKVLDGFSETLEQFWYM